MPPLPRDIHLTLCASSKRVSAQIVLLTPEMVATRMKDRWWDSERIRIPDGYDPVDIAWDWSAFAEAIRNHPDEAQAIMVAVVTPDEDIQGAMLIHRESSIGPALLW